MSGVVYLDNDRTGATDSNNPGLAGAVVQLLDSDNDAVASTTSGVDGSYSLSASTGGTYTVSVTVPEGYIAYGSSLTVSTPVTLESGVNIEDFNAPVFPANVDPTITGNVFVDSDGLGIPDFDNAGVSGVSVALYQDGGAVATTTTDANGNYSFTVSPGFYGVQIGQPSGYDLEGTTDSTFTAIVAAPSLYTVVNEGVYTDASLGGTVAYGSGGLSGVGVTLTDSSGNEVASTTTGTGGTYTLSTTLAPGTYTAAFTAPSGYVFDGSSGTYTDYATVGSGQNATLDETAYSSTVDATISGTVFNDVDASGMNDGTNPGLSGVTVTLLDGTTTVATTTTDDDGNYSFSAAPGTYTVQVSDPSGYTLENTTSSTWTTTVSAPGPDTVADEGVYQTASASGLVFDGTSPVSGVSVEISDINGNDDGMATTASDGSYEVTGLAPGAYYAIFTAPSGHVFAGGSTTTTSGWFVVGSGGAATGVSATAYGSTEAQVISGYVFADDDGSGVYDSSNSGLSGVTVTITTTSGGSVTNASDETVEPVTTNSLGGYTFSNLLPGTYDVVVTAEAVVEAGDSVEVAAGAEAADRTRQSPGSRGRTRPTTACATCPSQRSATSRWNLSIRGEHRGDDDHEFGGLLRIRGRVGGDVSHRVRRPLRRQRRRRSRRRARAATGQSPARPTRPASRQASRSPRVRHGWMRTSA